MLNIRSALAALLVFGGAVAVRAQAPTTPQAHGKTQGCARAGPGMDADQALLRGMTLSDGEKANLKAVHSKYASQMKAIRDAVQAAERAAARGAPAR